MKKIVTRAAVAAISLAGSIAHAAGAASNGGVVTVDGLITAQTCTVNGNGQGQNFTVTLPSVSASDLSAAGSTAGAVNFSIALSGCTPATGNVHTFWEYGSNTLADGNLLNNGTASNVEVQLVDHNGAQKTIDVSKVDGSQNSQSVAIASGAATLQYAAQYVTPTGGATGGSVTTNVTYSMAYE